MNDQVIDIDIKNQREALTVQYTRGSGTATNKKNQQKIGSMMASSRLGSASNIMEAGAQVTGNSGANQASGNFT